MLAATSPPVSTDWPPSCQTAPCRAWPCRTGDTPGPERQVFRHDPPEVLLTTPESLSILLSQSALGPLFAGLRWLVVDEVHALAPTKRGADLALSLERLSIVAAPQRIGLSATAAPLAEAARFLVGTDRPCAIAEVHDESPLDLRVVPLADGPAFLADLMRRLIPELGACRSTLIFANTRRLAERLAWALRHRLPEWDDQIAVHHSSLATPRRREVEGLFKHGRLRVVVSSTSLELGIDIGSVDLVALVHPPGGVVRLLQRVGRAGHGPGRVRRGLVFTASPAELLEAVVTGASGRAAECEPLCAREPAGRALPADRRHGGCGNGVGRRYVRTGPAFLPLSRPQKGRFRRLPRLPARPGPRRPAVVAAAAARRSHRPGDPRRTDGSLTAPQFRHDPGGGTGDGVGVLIVEPRPGGERGPGAAKSATWTRRSPTACCPATASCWTVAAWSSAAAKALPCSWRKCMAVRRRRAGPAPAGQRPRN